MGRVCDRAEDQLGPNPFAREHRVLELTRCFEEVTRRISRAVSLQGLAEVAIQGARQAFGADAVGIYLSQESGSALKLLRGAGLEGARRSCVCPARSLDLHTEEALRRRSPVWIEGSFAAREEGSRSCANGDEHVASLACVPLLLDDEAWGVLVLGFHAARLFDEDERRFMVLLADHCALAVARAHAFDEMNASATRLRVANRELERERRGAQAMAEYLARLQRVSAGLASAATVHEIASVVMREGAAALGAPQAALAVPAGAGRLRLISHAGVNGRDVEQEIPEDSNIPLSIAFHSRALVVLQSIEEHQQHAPDFEPQRRAFGTQASVCAPITVGGRVLGTIGFGFVEPRRFVERDLEFLSDLSALTALALTRAELFERETEARALAEDALVRARLADRRKDEFLAMLGHELRNPLAPISTALELMRLRAADPFEREHAIIARQVQHLECLVNDLLDVSRVTQGKLTLRRERLELSELVARAVDVVSAQLESKRHQLTVDVARGLYLSGDPIRLCQVLTNLLTNAAKYTDDAGHIQVKGRLVEGMIELVVEDDGTGIDASLLPHVFEMFAQAPQCIARSQGGLGLGLTIVKQLVELHGGRVEAHSAGRGAGSRFVVRLPAELAVEAAKSARVEEPREGRRVLVVDDNEDAVLLLADTLARLGYSVRTAIDGPSALEEARRFSPQVVCLDIGLPLMDGYEVAERLRAEHGRSMQLVAVTGYGQEHDRTRSLACGFDRHLVKPLSLEALLSACEC